MLSLINKHSTVHSNSHKTNVSKTIKSNTPESYEIHLEGPAALMKFYMLSFIDKVNMLTKKQCLIKFFVKPI